MYSYGNINFTGKLPNEFFEDENSEFSDLLKIKDSLDRKLKELELKLKLQNGLMDERKEEFYPKHLRATVYFGLKCFGA